MHIIGIVFHTVLEFLVRPHLKVGEVFEEGVAEESVLM
jgi:hypothetical protein